MKKLILIPEYVFLAFAVIFGFVFVFLTPPLQVPDENSHFLRAYQVSDFNFIAQPFEKDGKLHYGAQIPTSIVHAIPGLMGNIAGKSQNEFNIGTYRDYVTQPLNIEEKENVVIEAAGVYSPIVYIPQAIGINIGKVFDTSPLLLIWLGRVINLSIWILVVFLAIRMLPFAKWALVALALNPVALFMAASLSPDVVNIGFAFLFVSTILATIKAGKVLGKREIIIILVTLSVLALSKPVNLLFALLLLAVPMRYFSTRLKYILFCVGGLLLALSLFLIWNYQIRDILDAAVFGQSGGRHIAVKDQLQFILSSPFGYIKTIAENYILVLPHTSGDAVLTTYFGVFGWLDTSIPLWVMMTYLLIVFLSLLYQFGRGVVLALYQKVIFITVLILGFVGNITAMYFNATPVGSNAIGGVQGRYFIPFTILLIVLFTARKKILLLTNKQMAVTLICSLSVVLLMTAYELAARYY